MSEYSPGGDFGYKPFSGVLAQSDNGPLIGTGNDIPAGPIGGANDSIFPQYNVPMSNPVPYVEPDKTARAAAIFQGAAGFINSVAGVYNNLRYAPKPNKTSTLPPSYFAVGAGTLTTNALLPVVLIVVGGLVLISVLRKH